MRETPLRRPQHRSSSPLCAQFFTPIDQGRAQGRAHSATCTATTYYEPQALRRCVRHPSSRQTRSLLVIKSVLKPYVTIIQDTAKEPTTAPCVNFRVKFTHRFWPELYINAQDAREKATDGPKAQVYIIT